MWDVVKLVNAIYLTVNVIENCLSTIQYNLENTQLKYSDG
ncbi:20341_t:CDS:2 [Gigaspora margarita]|uniref:20341_t:CDS:1 n=1 Tax=Gigaspora margarita TaxID=4874 RepID=A0ABM8VXY2_GIGMA|nr:20341_t:CDS:2 [Gigaspora margarita]